MENQINIAEILKNKPKGTKLYSPICGECELNTIDSFDRITEIYTIGNDNEDSSWKFDDKGRYNYLGECMLFPSKQMRDWSKFAWKKGDVLVSNDGRRNTIFYGFTDDTYTSFKGKHSLEDNEYIGNENSLETEDYTLKGENSAQLYINTIEEKLGGKLNMETLEIEKPMFKDGDILFIEGVDFNFVIIFCSKNPSSEYKDEYAAYASLSDMEICYEAIHDVISFDKVNNIRIATEEEKQLLVNALAEDGKHWNAETKQIEDIKPKWTPKPFDRIVAFCSATNIWCADIFSHITEFMSYNCIGGCYDKVLPYNEETAKLIGTAEEYKEG